MNSLGLSLSMIWKVFGKISLFQIEHHFDLNGHHVLGPSLSFKSTALFSDVPRTRPASQSKSRLTLDLPSSARLLLRANVVGIDAEPALLSHLVAVQPEDAVRRDRPCVEVMAGSPSCLSSRSLVPTLMLFPVRLVMGGKGRDAASAEDGAADGVCAPAVGR